MTLRFQPVSCMARRTFCPPRPDGLGELALVDRDIHGARFFIHQNGHDIRGGHRVDDVLGGVVVPGDDVHPFAAELVGNRPGPLNRAFPRRRRRDRLRASRDRTPIFARRPESRAAPMISMSPSPDFRDFDPEQLLEKFRRGATDLELGTARLGDDGLKVTPAPRSPGAAAPPSE